MDLSIIRKDYARAELSRDSIDPNPLVQFNKWLQEAILAKVPEPTGMHLATCDNDGNPTGRIVLLKGVDNGFVFYTNYLSTKGSQLAQNPKASLTFWWAEVERQVRIEGLVEKVSSEESESYFHSRPRASQISAAVSPQSKQVASRHALEIMKQQFEEKTGSGDIPRPGFWGGFRVIPQKIEFWQGRQSRYHDRLVYERSELDWRIYRLAP